MHVLIQGDTDENVNKAVELIEPLLNLDDQTNEHKKNQLIQLAAIKGILRDEWCENCGEKGHRSWNCPNT